MTEEDIFDILNDHIQIERNKRCSCGWRPTYPDTRSMFPEYLQHREHVASTIAKVIKGSN